MIIGYLDPWGKNQNKVLGYIILKSIMRNPKLV